MTDRVETVADRNGEVGGHVGSDLDHEGGADVDPFGIPQRELVLLEDLRYHANQVLKHQRDLPYLGNVLRQR